MGPKADQGRLAATTIILKPVGAVLLFLLVGTFCIGSHQGKHADSAEQQPSSTSFTLTVNQSYVTALLGSPSWSSSSVAITVSSLNGFSGNVTFSQPVAPSGLVAVLSTYRVPVAPSAPGSTILNLTLTGPIQRDARDCVYGCPQNVTVTAFAGSSSQTVTISDLVYVPEFWLYSDQNVVVVDGTTGYANVSLVSEWFVGSVSFTANVTPAGPKMTFDPATIMLTYQGGGHTRVMIDTAGVSIGEYNITVTATAVANPSLSHRVRLYTTVWLPESSPAAPTIWSSILPYFPTIPFLLIVILLTIALFLDKEARKRNPSGEASSSKVESQI